MDGSVLCVYGRVVAAGREMDGDTVKGTCANNGWEPRLISGGIWDMGYGGENRTLTLVMHLLRLSTGS